ncbi:MAG: MFS transporter [Mycobacterium sp.]
MNLEISLDGEAVRAPMSRGRALALLALVILLAEGVPFAYTFVMPALSDIAVHYQTAEVTWAVTVLTLSGAVFTPLVGKLGDMHGKKRWLLITANVFVVGDVLSAVAPSFTFFLVGRAMQGVGLPMLVLTYGLIRDLLPRELVTTALGFVATGMGASAVVGPFVGGYLIDRFGFAGIFWFLAVYTGALAGALAATLPESPIRVPGKLDMPGVLLLTAGVTLLTLGVGEVHAWGLVSARTIVCATMGVAFLVGWFFYQRVPAEPLIDLSLVEKPAVALTLVGSFFLQFTLGSHAMLMPMFAMMRPEDGLGYGWGLSALGVSQITVFTGVTGMIAGPLAGRYCRRGNPGLMLALGGISMAVACAIFAASHAAIGSAMLSAALFGVGIGVGSAALPNLIVLHTPAPSQGIAGGMVNEMGTIGSAFGTQITIAMLSIPGVSKMRGASVYHVSGYAYAFWVLAAAGILAGLAGLAIRSPRGKRHFSGAPAVDEVPDRVVDQAA